ncbi:hypothetical protein CVU75_00530 [Candidatus Dependentiae bacterium HGW-Dependentiae-1]|nr:MAG: hypothetical protein CVU75_00530 [Candidatus Dependentiae bacterium HGW-Dependentiae-1]
MIGSLPTIARSSSEAIGSLADTIAECFEKKEPTLGAQQNQTTQARLDERAVIEQLFTENCQLRDQAEQAHETLDKLTAENNALRARLTEQAPPPPYEE